MIDFTLENVVDEWLDATFAPDWIDYTVETEAKRINGHMYRIQEFVALYECLKHQIPSAEHPSTTVHDIRLMNGVVEFDIEDTVIKISLDEVKAEYSQFLKVIFEELDEITESTDRREKAFRRISDSLLEDDFETLYREIMRE